MAGMITKKEPGVYVSEWGTVYDFRHLDRDQELKQALKNDSPAIPGDKVDIEKVVKGARLFNERFLR